MSNRKFVKVEQAGKCPTEWLIDLGTVVRMHPDSNFVVFDDGAGIEPHQGIGGCASEGIGGGEMSRTSDRVCMLELNTDMTRIVCSKCGWEVPAGTNPNTVRE